MEEGTDEAESTVPIVEPLPLDENEAISEQVENPPISEHVENEPVSEQVENAPISEHVDNEPVSEQVENEPISEQVENEDQQIDGENEEVEPEEPFVSIFDELDKPRELQTPVLLNYDHIKQIEDELGLIRLCWPEAENPEFEGRLNFPESYTKNTEKEKLLLSVAENFRRQYAFKYPSRKPLFLACDNECKVKKMVCTSICPTILPYAELEDWKNLTAFFGDHLDYEILENPTLFVSETLHITH